MRQASFLIIGLILPWLLFLYLTATPQVVLIKHPPPEQNQFIYRSNFWIIPVGFVLLIFLNLLLKKLAQNSTKNKRTLFDTANYLIFVYNILLVGYLIYLNY